MAYTRAEKILIDLEQRELDDMTRYEFFCTMLKLFPHDKDDFIEMDIFALGAYMAENPIKYK
jgi:hypothetical protein